MQDMDNQTTKRLNDLDLNANNNENNTNITSKIAATNSQSSQASTASSSSYSHEKAQKYLESLEQENQLDDAYNKTRDLMQIVNNAPSFYDGFKNAIEKYKTIKQSDNKSFILIQFLETFYEGLTIDETYYTKEMHEANFNTAVELARSVSDDQNQLLGQIYSTDSFDI